MVYMQRRVGKIAATPCITQTVKHRGGFIVVLGDFANCKIRDLIQVKGKLNQTGNHSILQHHLIPSGTQLVAQGSVIMQDYDPKHTSKLCQEYIKSREEQYVIQLMFWPAQLVDLNPIKLVWD